MHHFSIPELVMRTGVIAPFSPNNVRADVQVANVVQATTLPVGEKSTAIAQLAPSAGGPEVPSGTPAVNGYEFGIGFGAADGVDIMYGPLSNPLRYVVTTGAAAAVGAGVGAAINKRRRGKGALFGALAGALTGVTALVVDSWARK